jgi:hypothetical protein
VQRAGRLTGAFISHSDKRVAKTTRQGTSRTVLLTKYYSGDHINNNEMGGACETMGDKRGAYGVLVGRPEGKRPLGRPRRTAGR